MTSFNFFLDNIFMKNIFLFVFIGFIIHSQAQINSKTEFSRKNLDINKTGWTSKELNRANTFHKIAYLTLEEKMIIYYINLARINSKKFAKTILSSYIDSIGTANNQVNSLKRDLLVQKNTKPLTPEKELCQMAKNYAIFQSKTSQIGSQNFVERIKKLCESERYFDVKELMVYSKNKPLDIAISILAGSDESGAIPEDIAKKQRKVIFAKDFNTIGLSVKTHTEYEYVCIFEIGNRDYRVKKPLTPKQKQKIEKKQRKLDFKNRKRMDKGKKPKEPKKDKDKMDCNPKPEET